MEIIISKSRYKQEKEQKLKYKAKQAAKCVYHKHHKQKALVAVLKWGGSLESTQ